MIASPDRKRSSISRSFALSCALCMLLHFALGCAYSTRVQTPRTSWEQILATEAIDRAVKQLHWPDLDGESVYVEIGSPGDALDPLYLQRSIEIAFTDRGARITRNAETARYFLTCLIGGVGLDIGGRFLGIMGSSGGLIPFTVPELALYKSTRREGFAKAEIYLVDRETNQVVHHSGPVEGKTYRRSTTYFFVFESREGDTTRLE